MTINTNKTKSDKFKGRNFKCLVIYISIVLIFIVYLANASEIATLFISNTVRKESIDVNKLSKNNVQYCFDTIEYYNDFLNNVYFAGWAFCETLEDNSDKEIWFVFISDKASYKFKNEISSSNLYRTFSNKYKISGNNHRFYSTVSTAVMRNGIYKLYIYCKENDDNYGLADTGILLEKRNDSISKYTWTSSEYKITETSTGAVIRSNIDAADINEEGYYTISGWAFAEHINTLDQYVYVRLKNDEGKVTVYNTANTSRPDVGMVYKNEMYNNSGFKAIIPADEIGEGNIEIEVLVEKDGRVYLSQNSYIYMPEGGSKSETKEESTVKGKTDNSNKIVFSDIEESSDIRYHIDSCIAKSDISINAWSFIKDIESSQTKIYLAITSADGSTRVYTTNKRSRPDVAKAYKNELYTESGFTASIPIDAISEGENMITIIAENGQQLLKAEKPYKYSYIPENNKQ